MLQLNDPDPNMRIQAITQLGRLRSPRAVDPLIRVLNADRVPAVRDAAAKSLGMIGSPGGLAALQRTAQADQDKDVRQSSQFATDIIRASLQGR